MDAGGPGGRQGSATGNYELLLNGGIPIRRSSWAARSSHSSAGVRIRSLRIRPRRRNNKMTCSRDSQRIPTTLLYKFNSAFSARRLQAYRRRLDQSGWLVPHRRRRGTIRFVMTLSASSDCPAVRQSRQHLRSDQLQPRPTRHPVHHFDNGRSGCMDLVVTPYMTASGATWISPASGSWLARSTGRANRRFPSAARCTLPAHHHSHSGVTEDSIQAAERAGVQRVQQQRLYAGGDGGNLTTGRVGWRLDHVSGRQPHDFRPRVAGGRSDGRRGGASLQLAGHQ